MSKRDRADRARQRLNLKAAVDHGVVIHIAETLSDLEQAFGLAYSAYLEKGYMDSVAHALRVNKYLLFPSSTTIVAKKDNKVIGCVTVVSHEGVRVPSSEIFDLQPLKKRYRCIVEATSLAISPEYRKSHGALLFSLLKYLFHFSHSYYQADVMFAAVNPKQQSFYENIMLFEKVEGLAVEPSKAANGAPAVALYLDFTNWQDRFFDTYSAHQDQSNLYKYFFEKNEADHIYPRTEYFAIHYNPMSPETLKKLLKADPEFFNSPFSSDYLDLSRAFAESKYDSLFRRLPWEQRPNRRFPSAISLFDRKRGLPTSGLVTNVSKQGLGLSVEEGAPQSLVKGFYRLRIGPDTLCQVQLEPVWQKPGRQGLRLVKNGQEWQQMIDYLSKDNEGDGESNLKKSA